MVERRQSKRYAMPRGTFAILRNKLAPLRNHARMSIGEIAMVLYKSKMEMMGQVADMSIDGIAFDGDRLRVPTTDDIELDLLLTVEGIYLHNVPFDAHPRSSECDPAESLGGPRKTVLRFKNLDAEQKTQLEELMSHHTG